MWRRAILPLTILCFSTVKPASGNSITIFSAFGSDTVVQDQGSGDQDPTANTISVTFARTGTAADWSANGTLIATTVPGVSATTILTDLEINEFISPPPPVTTGAVSFMHEFPAIGPPAVSTASLTGQYISVNPIFAVVGGTDIRFEPLANGTSIGTIDPPSGAGALGSATFDGPSGPIFVVPVTSHRGLISFQVANDDLIAVPASAEIQYRSTRARHDVVLSRGWVHLDDMATPMALSGRR